MSNLETPRVQRLDQKVVELKPSISRAFAAKLIGDGKVTVNESVITKSGHKLKEGDVVSVEYDEAEQAKTPTIDLPIMYEDDDCVVINKPVGVLTHSKGAFNPEATVATWLQSRLKNMQGERAGIVHRLDRATSGVMICAKTPEALSWLQKQFSQRRTKKTYAAIIEGRLKQPEAVIDMPIGRNPKALATFRVDPNGKMAQTYYRVVKESNNFSLVELKPVTGRTHQLRVHLNHLGHPILGDTFYGGRPADRLYLHAHELELTLPNMQRKTFSAPIPAEFDIIMKG